MSDNTPNWTDKLGAVGTAVGALGSVANVFSGFENARAAERMNAENLAFQRENLAYQKELQNTIFQREDTANQRTVADMRAAGLSPLTMSGTNGAGQVISTSAPQNDISGVMSGVSQKQAAFMNMANQMNATVQFAQNKQSLELQREQTEADINLKNAQAEAVRGQESRANELHPYEKEYLQKQSDKLSKEITNLSLLNTAQEINNNFLTAQKEHEATILTQTIAKNAVEYSMAIIEKSMKENDLDYLITHGLSTYSSDVEKIASALANLDEETLSKIQTRFVYMLRNLIHNTFHFDEKTADEVVKSVSASIGIDMNQDFAPPPADYKTDVKSLNVWPEVKR